MLRVISVLIITYQWESLKELQHEGNNKEAENDLSEI